MPQCLISFGANIGDSLETIRLAADLLRRRFAGDDSTFLISRFFRTPPVGGPTGQPPFVNAVAAASTRLSTIDVWQAIREVEQQLGRERNQRWEARRIDLDILLYEQERVWTDHLKIPHPRMCMRRFILVPALDVAADWIDPVSKRSIRELAELLRTGAGNLVLIAPDDVDARGILRQVAQRALATLVDVRVGEQLALQSRWVATITPQELREIPLATRGAKLLIFIAQSSNRGDQAWEAGNRSLAESLDLVAAATVGELPDNRPRISGPRYLLASDDRQWAIHEMVAALEAMDCPIEPIF